MTRITVEATDEEGFPNKMVLDLSDTLTIWEMRNYLFAILKFMTYGEKNIIQLFKGEEE